MLASKATLFERNEPSMRGLPQTCPSVCLRLPFAEMHTPEVAHWACQCSLSVHWHRELCQWFNDNEPENFSSYLK